MTTQEERVELARTISRDPQQVRRLVRLALLDVAIEGRRAVHRRAASATYGKPGRAYRQRPANDPWANAWRDAA